MSDQAIVLLAAVAAACGVLAGYICGRAHGRDEQWVEDFIEQGRRERARRDRHGRFRAKEAREV